MNNILEDILLEIASHLNGPDLYNLLQTNKRIKNLTVDNQSFWRLKFNKEYDANRSGETDWKKLYLGIGRVYLFGQNLVQDIPEARLNYSKGKGIPSIEGITAESVACGEMHSAIICPNGQVYVFGKNKHGQLGLGRYSKREKIQELSIRARRVALGKDHTLLLDLHGNVYATGSNSNGQLGLGRDVVKICSLTQVPNIRAKSIACGDYHSVIIDIDDNLLVFGCTENKRIGLSGDDVFLPYNYKVNKVNKVKHVSCGSYSTIVIDSNNRVEAFGSGLFSPLNLAGLNQISAKTSSSGEYFGCVIDMDDRVHIFGESHELKIPNPITLPNIRVRQAVCGYQSLTCVDYDNDLFLVNYDDIIAQQRINYIGRIRVYQVACQGDDMICIGR